MRAAPDDVRATDMRARVLSGWCEAWEAGPRSAAELREAATLWERAAALCNSPAAKVQFADLAALCQAEAV